MNAKPNFSLLSLAFCLFFLPLSLSAQLSKQDKKRWDDRKKKMSTEVFKETVEGYEASKAEIESLRRQVQSLAQSNAQRQVTIDSLNGLQKEQVASNPSLGGQDDYSKGVIFRVQIGAFRNKDLMKYVNNKRFHAEEDADGVKKYTIATFRDYWEADLFKKYLREMGVNDAWIVSYKDGERADIKNVLSQEDIEAVEKAEKGGSAATQSSGEDW
ncbi:hypothetical protein [Hugenholtzia roseola]|uniref:hypothetical protein n=1 Tax=Hugenholtzia roseola TaxID=1002 RepID=UPI0004030371|nr:hypothetical protein [Hugenholtzia roseola]